MCRWRTLCSLRSTPALRQIAQLTVRRLRRSPSRRHLQQTRPGGSLPPFSPVQPPRGSGVATASLASHRARPRSRAWLTTATPALRRGRTTSLSPTLRSPRWRLRRWRSGTRRCSRAAPTAHSGAVGKGTPAKGSAGVTAPTAATGGRQAAGGRRGTAAAPSSIRAVRGPTAVVRPAAQDLISTPCNGLRKRARGGVSSCSRSLSRSGKAHRAPALSVMPYGVAGRERAEGGPCAPRRLHLSPASVAPVAGS